eukprot:6398287-Amphidinium_carterae.2
MGRKKNGKRSVGMDTVRPCTHDEQNKTQEDHKDDTEPKGKGNSDVFAFERQRDKKRGDGNCFWRAVGGNLWRSTKHRVCLEYQKKSQADPCEEIERCLAQTVWGKTSGSPWAEPRHLHQTWRSVEADAAVPNAKGRSNHHADLSRTSL